MMVIENEFWPQGSGFSLCKQQCHCKLPVGVFNNNIGHLQWVTKLVCSPQSQFIPSGTLSASSTILFVELVNCEHQ
jgi:hypothetical protein